MEQITKIKRMILIAIFSALIAVGGMITIPIGAVPITLQTVFVLLSAYVLGAKGAASSQLLYILLGLIGLPVFSRGGAGLGHLLGPTGGYILGFIPSVLFVGYVFQKKTYNFFGNFIVFFLGLLIIYFVGVMQLMYVANIDAAKAIIVGALIFIPIDLLKILGLTVILRYIPAKK